MKRCCSGDILLAVSIVAVGVPWALFHAGALDLSVFDEAAYLQSGVRLADRGFPAWDGAPLYAAWYGILSRLEPDPVRLYFASVALLSVLVPVAFFFLLRTLAVERSMAWTLSVFLLVERWNVLGMPRVSHLAAALLCVGVGVALRRKRSATTFAVLLTTVVLAALVRPEYALGLLGDGQRALLALGQHYALHWVRWTTSSLEPWTEWQSIFRTDFPGAQSVMAAVLENPAAFARHVLENLMALPREVAALGQGTSAWSFVRYAYGPLLLGWIALAWRRRSGCTGSVRRAAKTATFLSVPCLIALLVVAPRTHYLYVVAPLWAAVLAAYSLPKRPGPAERLFTVLAVVWLSFPVEKSERPNLRVVETLRSLAVSQPTLVLEAESGYATYAGGLLTGLAVYEMTSPFGEYLARNASLAVVDSPGLRRSRRVLEDAGFSRWLKTPESYGFRKVPVSGVTDRAILLRR